MSFPLQQIQSTVKCLVHEGLAGWKPEKKGNHLDTGLIIKGRYRIEEGTQRDGSRSLNTVSLVRGGEFCDRCRLKGEVTHNSACNYCGDILGERVFQMEVFPWQIESRLIKKLLEISHPGVVKICDIFSAGPNTYVVSDYLPGPTLDRLDGRLRTHQIRTFGVYLAQTVEFLHDQGISHMNLQPFNLKLDGDRPRLVSLSTCTSRADLPREDVEWVDREDFRRILETLERLAGEFVDEHEDDMLCRLLFALEDMIGKKELSAIDISEALAAAHFESEREAWLESSIAPSQPWMERFSF